MDRGGSADGPAAGVSVPFIHGRQEGAGETGLQRQRCHLFARRRDLAVGVDRAEVVELLQTADPGGGRPTVRRQCGRGGLIPQPCACTLSASTRRSISGGSM